MNQPDRCAGESEAKRLASVYGAYAGQAAKRWDLANPGYHALVEERRRLLEQILVRSGLAPLGGRRVLDAGCGFGQELAELLTLGAAPEDLVGVDLLPDRIEAAHSRHPGIDYRVGDATALDFPPASFDLVLSQTVFSSILDDAVAAAVAAEMTRVLRPGGAIVWYDIRYPSPANRNVRPISRRRLARLFAGLQPRLRSVSLLPPLARRLGSTASWAYPLLAALPPLRSHLIGLLLKPGPPAASE